LSLAFSWIRLNLGFLLREKLAAVLIIPSSWGSQLDGDLHHQHRAASVDYGHFNISPHLTIYIRGTCRFWQDADTPRLGI
jgi:hypothetical protein